MGSKPIAFYPQGRDDVPAKQRHRPVVYRHAFPDSSLPRIHTPFGAPDLLPMSTSRCA